MYRDNVFGPRKKRKREKEKKQRGREKEETKKKRKLCGFLCLALFSVPSFTISKF